MGKLSRDKGGRVEREIVNRHKDMGVKAERVPLSGATRYQGNGADIDIYPLGPDAAPIVCEVKARKVHVGESNPPGGFKTIERWLADYDALFLRRDRQEPLVVLPWRTWERLLNVTKRGLL